LAENKKTTSAKAQESILQFETGNLTKEQLDGLLNTLPVDITFVDADDAVRYFNKPENRIFMRPKAVLGRKVHNCHPQKSLHIVNKIVESFKKDEKNVAEFWINLNNRFVHIRFFAVRDVDGKYLGTMEVVQDLTEPKKLQGERRLLDWEQ
jgi:PAS domain S-box-containing protein